MGIDLKEIGHRVRDALKAAGYDQNDLAKRVGLTASAISNNLTGKTAMSTETYVAVADMTGKSIDWLMTGKEPQTNTVVSEQAETYSEFKIVRDVYEMKVEGRTLQERIAMIQQMLDAIRR